MKINHFNKVDKQGFTAGQQELIAMECSLVMALCVTSKSFDKVRISLMDVPNLIHIDISMSPDMVSISQKIGDKLILLFTI